MWSFQYLSLLGKRGVEGLTLGLIEYIDAGEEALGLGAGVQAAAGPFLFPAGA